MAKEGGIAKGGKAKVAPSNVPDKTDLASVQEEELEHLYGVSILAKKPAWRDFNAAKMLSPTETGLLLDFDQNTKDARNELLRERGEDYAAVFVKAVGLQNKEPRQYILTIVSDFLQADPEKAALFPALQRRGINPFSPFFSILERTEEIYSVGRAAHILSLTLRGQSQTSRGEVEAFIRWAITTVKQQKGRLVQHAVSALKNLLKDIAIRDMFVQFDGALSSLLLLTRDVGNTQLLYLVGYCIWLLSFRKDILPALHDAQVVGTFTELIKNVTREKVIRVVVATFVNMLNNLTFNEEMVGAGLHKVVDTLAARKWKDEDIVKDLEKLDTVLEEKRMALSSFEMYHAEVVAGNLRWSPVHNEQFWRENTAKFDDDNFDLIKRLLAVLTSPHDSVAYEVACYDLGEFARFHPDGKRVLNHLKAKSLLMSKMSSPDPKVARQALLAVQKLLVSNWESLSAGGVNKR